MGRFVKISVTYLILFFINNLGAFSNNYNYPIKTDSINKTDEKGLKQGYWIIYTKDGDHILEKGTYVNNKKNGVWIRYFENDTVENEINYMDGKPRGEARFYYKNGRLRESGNWQIDHWQGSYKYYFETGQLSYDWHYNEYGRREGEQKYFHENGEKMYEGSWKNGKTEGDLLVYNEQGELTQKKIFNNGVFAETKKHHSKASYDSIASENEDAARDRFRQTGFHTITDLSGHIIKKGFFVKGELFNGEEYLYDEKGTLSKIMIFKNGKLITTKEK